MATYFWPDLMKCPKMGSNGQIFASLLVEKSILNHIKHIIILKDTPRNGVVWCVELDRATIPFTKGLSSLFVCLYICLFVCLFVRRFSQHWY